MYQKGFHKIWCRAVCPESLRKCQGIWQDSQEWMSSVGNSPCGVLTWTPIRHPDTWSFLWNSGYSTDSSILCIPTWHPRETSFKTWQFCYFHFVSLVSDWDVLFLLQQNLQRIFKLLLISFDLHIVYSLVFMFQQVFQGMTKWNGAT